MMRKMRETVIHANQTQDFFFFPQNISTRIEVISAKHTITLQTVQSQVFCQEISSSQRKYCRTSFPLIIIIIETEIVIIMMIHVRHHVKQTKKGQVRNVKETELDRQEDGD